ncbi:MAG: aryl-sulfate sulfotransferase [Desulfopila sp.]
MKKILATTLLFSSLCISQSVLSAPTVFPTGTTIYNPDKAWSGYTVFPAAGQQGCVLIDMNGNVVKFWKGLKGEPGPNKMLPGGFVYGALDIRPGYQDYVDLSLIDWDGNIVWQFNKAEKVTGPDGNSQWMARQHHDFQHEGNPVGYYAPGADFKKNGNRLILTHTTLTNPDISDKTLEDDRIIEVNHAGEIVWEWKASDHFAEFGFSEAAKKAIHDNPNYNPRHESGDWFHINNMNWVGPNTWFDQGDERFAPDNIIIDGRETNILAIIDKKSGKIVWQLGPDYTASPELRKLGQIIGQHHVHIIPKGLPGEGNMMIFDNGGAAGYGAANSQAPGGYPAERRDFSRVLEINPITLEIVWQLDAGKLGYFSKYEKDKFFSSYISSAQRLANGNTLICEGSNGHFIEVTPDYEVVWDYVSPYFVAAPQAREDLKHWNMVYRAYRVPYEWVPQLTKPTEKAIIPPDNGAFTVPGSQWQTLPGAVVDLSQHSVKEQADEEDEGMEEFKSY